MTTRSAARIREELGHPVIDNDGHILEVTPLLLDYVGEIGGSAVRDRYVQATAAARENMFGRRPVLSLEERRYGWIGQSSWWSNTTRTMDRATSMLPRLYEERLGELGIDFAIVYPSEGLLANRIIGDDEVRVAACRAINTYQSEVYRGCSAAMRGVAVIPMQTPTEAIEELDLAVNELGFTSVLLASGASRLVPKYRDEVPDAAHLLTRIDSFGLDSEYDYDLVWQRCIDLGVAVTFHGSTVGSDGPRSPANLAFNRLGGGVGTYAMLSAGLLLGGVVSRFPGLTFAFQEGGVGWACNFYEKLVGMWEKRSSGTIGNYDPARLEVGRLEELVNEYGSPRTVAHAPWVRTLVEGLVTPDELDDFAALGAGSIDEVRDIFTRSFYVGCEADELSNARAFRGNAHDARIKITLGSDIGHWDVLDSSEVLSEAFELVEHGHITDEDFREFAFENAVELHARMNPAFFDGTSIEAEARAVMERRAERAQLVAAAEGGA